MLKDLGDTTRKCRGINSHEANLNQQEAGYGKEPPNKFLSLFSFQWAIQELNGQISLCGSAYRSSPWWPFTRHYSPLPAVSLPSLTQPWGCTPNDASASNPCFILCFLGNHTKEEFTQPCRVVRLQTKAGINDICSIDHSKALIQIIIMREGQTSGIALN